MEVALNGMCLSQCVRVVYMGVYVLLVAERRVCEKERDGRSGVWVGVRKIRGD